MQRARAFFYACAGLIGAAVATPLGFGVGYAAPRDTTFAESQIGFAFDVSSQLTVTHVVNVRGDVPGWLNVLTDHGGLLLEVQSEDAGDVRGLLRVRGLSDPRDTLLSYVKAKALEHCGGVSPVAERSGDSIMSVRRYRNVRGYQVFEVVERVLVESYAGVSTTFTPGPIYAVDLSHAGNRLVVWIRPVCDNGNPDKGAQVLARTISETLRRLKS